MAYIEIKDATKWYPHKSGKLRDIFRKDKSFVKAVDGVNLSMDRGEILGVIGESGCGKSTLGRMLTRLEDPTKGDVLVDGVSTAELIKKDPLKFRRTVQIVFQNPFDTFTPRDTIQKILCVPLSTIRSETARRKGWRSSKRLWKPVVLCRQRISCSATPTSCPVDSCNVSPSSELCF